MPFTLDQKNLEDEGKNKKSETFDRRLTIGLWGASFGTKNLGVAALTCGTIASFFHSFPNGRIFLLDYGREAANFRVAHPGGIATVEFVNIRFSKRFYLSNNIAYLLFLVIFLRILPFRRLRERLLQRNHVLNAISNADIISSIAGGGRFSDTYGLGRLIYVVLPKILVQLLGKPLVLLPQTVGPFHGIFAKAIALFILRRSRVVYTRDRSGLETVRALTGHDHGRLGFSYDMGFALDPHIRPEKIPPWLAEYDESIPLVGLNVRGYIYIGGYTRNNMFGIETDYHRLIHNLIA